ncbi:MAG: DUF4058 family protein [Phycisphaerae bacterium]|nr:DUF4058 family protein [Tepidisphaeraceae bacterium]
MPSPFPGMNPYLEHDSVFHGFHQNLIVEIQRALVPQIRPNYFADTDVNVYIHELSGDERLLGRPDVHLAESGRQEAPRTAAPSATMTTTPAVRSAFAPAVDVVEVPFVKIMDRQSRRVVTVIEVLSRTNKLAGPDRAAYLAKRNDVRRSDVHFIEIDLLRAGEPMPLAHQPDADYRVVLARADERPAVTLWPIRLRGPLPTVPVPLRAPDPDAHLDLQAIFHRVYDAAGYADYVYARIPQPPLHPEDARWAESLVAPPAGA